MAKREQPQHLIETWPYFRAWRKAAGLSQDQLASLLGISGAQLSKRETGQRKGVTLDFLVKFAREVGCNPWDPLAGPPGILPQIDKAARRLPLADQEMILRLINDLADRIG